MPIDRGPEKEAVRARVVLALQHCWAGSQRQMARDLGVSQAVISKVVNGVQGAGKRFLIALAKHPGVNAQWVIHGSGHPFPAGMNSTLPISITVLPGPPGDNAGLLTGDRHPVADGLNGLHRYWLRPQLDMAIVQIPDFKMAPGDLLLMETDGQWTRRTDLVAGRICAVRSCRGGNTVFDLALLRRNGESLIPFPAPPSDHDEATPQEPSTKTSEGRKRRRRIGRLLNVEDDNAAAPSMPGRSYRDGSLTHAVRAIQLADIVGVCVYLARPFPGLA